MTDVFISYSHVDREFAARLRTALTEHGTDVFMDEEDIPPASRWADDLAAAIEAAGSFVFIISPEAAASVECRRELDHAASLNKRLIPVRHRETPLAALPAVLTSRNFVPARGLFDADFDASLELLERAVDTDLEWVREHTAWGLKAIEWNAHQRDRSFLLSGTELTAAEQFLARGPGRDPAPTELQHNYVLASRRAASRRQRRLLAGVSIALIVAVVLGVVALIQRSDAVTNEHRAAANERQAESEQFAALAEDDIGSNPQASTQLALDGLAVARTSQAETALREALPDVQLLRTIAMPHRTPATSAAFSANGSEIVSTDGDTARVWNAASGAPGAVLREPSGAEITSAAFNADGTEVATASADGTAHIWNAATGADLVTIGTADQPGLYHVVWGPTGTLLLTAGADGYTRAWKLTGQPVAALADSVPQAGDQAFDAQFNRSGSEIVTATEDGAAVIYSSSPTPDVIVVHGSAVEQASFSPDGSEVLTTDGDGTAKVWSVPSNRLVTTLGLLGGAVIDTAAFSPDGHEIVTGGHDGTVNVWDAASGRELLSLSGHVGVVNSAAFSADGREIVTAGSDGTVRIWDATPREAHTIVREPGENALLSASFNRNGSRFATASEDGWVRLWDTASGKQLASFDEPSGDTADTVAFNPAGTELLVAGADGSARILGAATARPAAPPVSASSAALLDATWSPDGTEFVTAASDGRARVFDASTGAPLQAITPHPDQTVYSAVFSSDGKDLLTADSDGQVQIWDIATGKQVGAAFGTLGGPPMLTAAYDHGDTKVVAVGSDGVVRVWNLASRREQTLTTPSGDFLSEATFSPSATEVLAAADDGTALIWSLATGRLLTVLGERNGASVVSAVFNPRSSEVVTVDEAGRGIVWSTELAAPLADVERIAAERVPPLTASETRQYLAGNSAG